MVPGALHHFARANGGHTLTVADVAFSPDGRLLVGVGRDRSLRIWSLADGRRLHRIHAHGNWVQAVRFSPDGTSIATAGLDRKVRLWDPLSGEQRAELVQHANGVQSLLFLDRGKTLVSGGRDRTLWAWDVARSQPTAEVPIGDGGWISAIEGLDDPDRVAILAGRERPIAFWSLSQGRNVGTLEKFAPGDEAVTAMRVGADGRTLAVSVGRQIEIWNIPRGLRLAVLAGHTADVSTLAFSPDGRLLASGGLDNEIRIWEVDSGRPVCRLPGHQAWVNCLAWSPDLRLLASGGGDGHVIVWSLATALWLGQADDVLPAAEVCWERLAAPNPTAAYFALQALTEAADATVERLEHRLRPADADDDPLIALQLLLEELDHDDFPVRERAAGRLEALLPDLHEQLETAARQSDSEEVRIRLRRMLSGDMQVREHSSETLRHLRSIQLLERIAGPRALALLDRLAAGNPTARGTQDAAAAAARLRRRLELSKNLQPLPPAGMGG